MSSLKKPAIPSVITTTPSPLVPVLEALKENVEIMTGVRKGSPALTQLPASATTAQIIAAVNTIIQRLNNLGQ